MKYSYDTVLSNYELMNKCLNANDEKNIRFFHYTSQASFYAMFKDYVDQINIWELKKEEVKYVTLFASQMQYLNDKQEYIEGVKLIKNASIDTNQLFESIFITCFCGKEDLLSQWKYYGKDCGISIEFDFSSATKLCWFSLANKEKLKDPPFVLWADISPHKVFYDNHEENLKKIRNIVNNNTFKDIADKEAANIFIPYCKNNNFSEEDEYRLIFYPIQSKLYNNNDLLTSMEYRVTNGKIIPQFKCKIAYGDEMKAHNYIPVKSIMVGPGKNQRLVFNSIINMLERDKENVKFISDEEIETLLNGSVESIKNKRISLDDNERITYKTTDGIKISMSRIPFRD